MSTKRDRQSSSLPLTPTISFLHWLPVRHPRRFISQRISTSFRTSIAMIPMLVCSIEQTARVTSALAAESARRHWMLRGRSQIFKPPFKGIVRSFARAHHGTLPVHTIANRAQGKDGSDSSAIYRMFLSDVAVSFHEFSFELTKRSNTPLALQCRPPPILSIQPSR